MNTKLKIIFLILFIIIYYISVIQIFINKLDVDSYYIPFSILGFYPVSTGILAYFLFLYKGTFYIEECIKTILEVAVWLFAVFVISLVSWYIINTNLLKYISETKWQDILYHFDNDYQEFTLNYWVLDILYVLNILFWGWLTSKISSVKYILYGN